MNFSLLNPFFDNFADAGIPSTLENRPLLWRSAILPEQIDS